jgi:hypothetical protein
MLQNSGFVDSGFVKTCDEIVIGQGSRPTSPYVVNMPHGGHQVYQPPTDSMV